MKRIENVEIKDPDDQPLRLQSETGLEPATVGRMVRVVCLALRDQTRMTMLDAQQGLRVMRKVTGANGYIDLDPGDYKWIIEKVDQVAPLIFGVSAAVLREQLDAAVDIEPEAVARE